MKRLLMALVLGLACFGCSNECDDAADKLEECGAGDAAEVDTSSCDGKDECAAKCINASDCAELKAPAFDGPFIACLAKCG